MAIAINGSGTVTGISVGGLPDSIVDDGTLANDAVTLAKMASGTDGQIITYDASGNPSAVGPGSDGQLLTSTGAGSPPAFEAAPSISAYVGSFTMDQSTTGTQAVTGVGFAPAAVWFIGVQHTSSEMAIAFTNGTATGTIYDNTGASTNTYLTEASAHFALETSSNKHAGGVNSLDSDGFTIGKTKAGSPTGTTTVKFIAIK